MASVKSVLQRAAEIAAIVDLKTEELVAFNMWIGELQFHLKPLALARVFRELRISKHRLEITRSEQGDVHLDFKARGARWTTVVLNKDCRTSDWQDLLGGSSPARSAQAPLALTYAEAETT